MQINKVDAINSLGNWSVAIWNEDLSTIKFYNGENEISKPGDFPSNDDINARQADMQTKADSGDYKSVNEIIATY